MLPPHALRPRPPAPTAPHPPRLTRPGPQGVVKALFDARMLPRVLCGSSVGSIVAGIVATRNDEELRETFDKIQEVGAAGARLKGPLGKGAGLVRGAPRRCRKPLAPPPPIRHPTRLFKLNRDSSPCVQPLPSPRLPFPPRSTCPSSTTAAPWSWCTTFSRAACCRTSHSSRCGGLGAGDVLQPCSRLWGSMDGRPSLPLGLKALRPRGPEPALKSQGHGSAAGGLSGRPSKQGPGLGSKPSHPDPPFAPPIAMTAQAAAADGGIHLPGGIRALRPHPQRQRVPRGHQRAAAPAQLPHRAAGVCVWGGALAGAQAWPAGAAPAWHGDGMDAVVRGRAVQRCARSTTAPRRRWGRAGSQGRGRGLTIP
jgi:hypothetical protein